MRLGLRDVTKADPGAKTAVLRRCSLDLEAEVLALMGGVDRADSGLVAVAGSVEHPDHGPRQPGPGGARRYRPASRQKTVADP